MHVYIPYYVGKHTAPAREKDRGQLKSILATRIYFEI